MLKYNTLGAKLLMCSAEQVGVKSAKVGLLARQTAKGKDSAPKLLKSALPGGGAKTAKVQWALLSQVPPGGCNCV